MSLKTAELFSIGLKYFQSYCFPPHTRPITFFLLIKYMRHFLEHLARRWPLSNVLLYELHNTFSNIKYMKF